MHVVIRVYLPVKVNAGGFDAEKITVCPGIEPPPVNLTALFPEGESDANFVICNLPDSLYKRFDIGSKCRVDIFTCLDCNRSEFQSVCFLCCFTYLLVFQRVALDKTVDASPTAIKAVLSADI